MLGIVAVGVFTIPINFQGTHVGLYGALRGHLCDSTAFLSLMDSFMIFELCIRTDGQRFFIKRVCWTIMCCELFLPRNAL